MGDYRNDCCEPADCCEPCCEPHHECSHDCCCRSQNNCGGDAFGGFGIIILLAVLYLLFCSGDNNNGRGGLLGGLF